MRPDDTAPADDTARTPGMNDDTGDDMGDDMGDDEMDLDPDGAPCLVCGQTIPGPHPGLLCPDCTAVIDADSTPTTTTGTGTGTGTPTRP